VNTAPDRLPLRHGYSLRDLDQLARLVIAIDRWDRGDTQERHDAVLYAITEHLLTVDDRPTPRDLVNLGLAASNRHVAGEMHHHGYDPRYVDRGSGALPGYLRYWQTTGHTPWDERLVEHVALAQIWERLTLAQQQAVMALATTGDHQEAADSLGLTLVAFAGRLKKARDRVYALWHEHETPPRRRGRDKRVLSRSGAWRGRRLLTEADVDHLRELRAQGATYRDLAAETGYSAGALCNLLRGRRRPAREAVAA
jgi:hypothetical protein